MNELIREILNANDFISNMVIFMTRIIEITLYKTIASLKDSRQTENFISCLKALKMYDSQQISEQTNQIKSNHTV